VGSARKCYFIDISRSLYLIRVFSLAIEGLAKKLEVGVGAVAGGSCDVVRRLFHSE